MSLLSRLAVRAARAYGMLAQVGAPTNVSAEYLVVAGGAGGGSGRGGGGGAGGLLASTATLSTLYTYSITVGAGGIASAPAPSPTNGGNGNNSSIIGTGTSIISIGGGGGGSNGASPYTGISGGSGGGGPVWGVGGSGTSGQGNNGGTGDYITNFGTGGGGGAGAVGGNASGTTSGSGGAGTASSISGSSVTYAGGGGGGTDSNVTAGAGGLGGGGAGSNTIGVAGTNGTANLGGGGGGGSRNVGTGTEYAGGSGGSGIVIISYTSATPKFVGGTITTSGGKQIHTFTSSGTLSPITPITAEYLVVAGGGGAGAANGGGGGAGGFLTSSTTIYSGATYVVTVGAGGNGGAHATGTGATNGGNSVLSGTGITTITATGGGRGGSYAEAAASGGSGGGASNGTNTGGTGTSGQGNNGGSTTSTSTGNFAATGGGGAGAAGASLTGNGNATNGGIGLTSSITGTSTYYAGGGGGGANGGSNSSGGLGGGGAGAVNNPGTPGTANTGGGGGGSAGSNNGAAGGSGIVIISYAGSQQFNGGLVTTSGGNTIHTFTSSGALTPLTNNLNNSLRFRSSASAYLNRTFTSVGNRKTWTWSGWIKRGLFNTLAQTIFRSPTGNPTTGFRFSGTSAADSINDGIRIFFNDAASGDLQTTQVFRDPSAWYHIVVAVDTTQATAANRVKLYVNGNQVTAFSTATYPTQNYDTQVNSNAVHTIGYWDNAEYFDGYMTDINFIDGQALEPYYFGNNDANGVWKPIQYKGTYGTNGFYLTFGNTTSTTTLGYDSSPNGNNWTCNNISLTAGTTYDAMTDVPTNTSATVANYPTLNPLSNTSTLTEANLTATNILQAGTTMATPTTGKWYFEYTQTTSIPSGSLWVGVSSNTNAIADNQLQGYAYASDGRKVAYNSYTSGYGATWTNGDIIGCALDLDNQTITFYKNNVSQGTAFTSITAQPYVFALSAGGAPSTKGGSINCGQRPFAYTPPTGFVALNTFNLPTPTILQGNKYMDATLYTGTGTALNVVNAGQFKPDLVWLKSRSQAYNNGLFDSNRGTTRELVSNSAGTETNGVTGLTAFNSNGFTLGTNPGFVESTTTFVGWQWQAGQGSTSSNTQGSITSTVSVNTTAGFSIVTYTGAGTSAGTVGHGLGVAPKLIIAKTRTSAQSWVVYHETLGINQLLELNTTGAASTISNYWGSSAPTSTVFGVYTANNIGNNNYLNIPIVAYCFAAISGFSAFGSYTANGSADGPFIYTGFRPRWIMFKRTTSATNWYVVDTAIEAYNAGTTGLYPNTSAAESTEGALDILSNGFKPRVSSGAFNYPSGETFIYAAFAEHPFKNSNAR